MQNKLELKTGYFIIPEEENENEDKILENNEEKEILPIKSQEDNFALQ
jgi:hypothetical protein